jgi:hypothetical protein
MIVLRFTRTLLLFHGASWEFVSLLRRLAVSFGMFDASS